MSPRAAKICWALERHAAAFDLTRDGLGERLLTIASNGAYHALLRGEDADGNELAALSEDYAAWKEKRYPGRPIGILEHEMAKWVHFQGERAIAPDLATVTYGRNEEAKQEAAWFIEGSQEQNRPPRPFWGLTEDAVKESTEYLTKHLKASL